MERESKRKQEGEREREREKREASDEKLSKKNKMTVDPGYFVSIAFS